MKLPKFVHNTDFYAELRRRVNQHFEQNNIDQRGGSRIYLKAFILIGLLISFYIWLVFFTPTTWIALTLCGALGLLASGIGFNVMHDGSHGSFSNNPILNKAAALSLNILGGNDYMWHHKHVVLHHTFTNVDGVDDDIEIKPMMRMCTSQEFRPWHRYQHLYAGFLYAIMYAYWFFWIDYKKYFTSKINSYQIPKLSAADKINFWGGKILSTILFVALPWYMLGGIATAIGLTVFFAVTGVFISVVFQLAHTVEHADFPMPDGDMKLENEWAVHQIETTSNFATRNPIVTWYCGGLNFQIEHHLFPKISHIHYPQLSKIVKQLCEEYGVTYNEHEKMYQAIASHWRYLKQMGQPSLA